MTIPKEWMTPDELATYLRVPLGTVYNWRSRGDGPRGYKIGRHVRYAVEDVDIWLDSQADRGR